MQQSYSNPQNQPIKGVFIFKNMEEGARSKALDLLKSVHCRVISSVKNRVTVTSSRANLQKIKRSWLAKSDRSDLSIALNDQISQIILGGNV